MRIYGLFIILSTMMIAPNSIAEVDSSKSSISGDVFFKMFSDKTEADLRLDTIKKMESFSVKYSGTQLAKDAKKYITIDSQRSDPHLWIEDTFNFISKGLKVNPPKDANWAIRKDLLLMLDNPLHVDSGDEYHTALSKFYRSFLDDVVEEIRNTTVTKGVRIWHIYNMGFVVKTPNHTIAFDIFTRVADPDYAWMTFLTEKQTRDLAQLVDIAFVSHWHGDHANTEFLDAMSSADKQVYVPLDPDNYNKTQTGIIPIRTTRKGSPINVDGVRISSYPGFQGDIRCNVYVVDLDGYTISQNGDNCTYEIYKDIAANHPVDIALSNCWSGTNEYISALNPKIYITGHENELLHDITHRIAYLNTFGNIDRMGLVYPWKKDEPKPIILSCGESVSWVK
ncbi:MAG: MBL fold metallo-hydrolase [Armatimonadota bacterium]